jgi:hypothetical protein
MKREGVMQKPTSDETYAALLDLERMGVVRRTGLLSRPAWRSQI